MLFLADVRECAAGSWPHASVADTVAPAMIEPEDFGFTPTATLARVADGTRAPRHGVFWKTWGAAVFAQVPRLLPRDERDPGDPTATHEFISARDVRIGCAMELPQGELKGGLVALHGYENVPTLAESMQRWKSALDRGVAVLCVRVRGYPGSLLDVPRLVAHAGSAGGGEWITYGLEVPTSESGHGCEWSFSYAVADVVNACRAFRGVLNRQASEAPMFMHGESFGAALAIVASAQLTERAPMVSAARLAIGLPSMGDWPWRLAQKAPLCRGMGGVVRRFLLEHPSLQDEVAGTLRTFDTVVHARRVRCAVLCKLALRDDVVPAPTAAAVFNALATDPGLKWRFVTRYGHFDGGIADLRRHAAFEQAVDAFLDPVADPADVLAGVT
jgi:cephalosporin-C deacetylase-like acetyl esterase